MILSSCEYKIASNIRRVILTEENDSMIEQFYTKLSCMWGYRMLLQNRDYTWLSWWPTACAWCCWFQMLKVQWLISHDFVIKCNQSCCNWAFPGDSPSCKVNHQMAEWLQHFNLAAYHQWTLPCTYSYCKYYWLTTYQFHLQNTVLCNPEQQSQTINFMVVQSCNSIPSSPYIAWRARTNSPDVYWGGSHFLISDDPS